MASREPWSGGDGLDYVDARPKRGIITTPEKLKLALQEFEKARRAPDYSAALPWLGTTVTLAVASGRYYAESASSWAIGSTVLGLVCLCIVCERFVQAWRTRRERSMSVDNVVDDLMSGE